MMGDAQVLGLLAELALAFWLMKVHGHQAELLAARMGAEHVFQVPASSTAGGDAGRDPHELLQLLDAGRHRHALRRGVEAQQHVDLLPARPGGPPR